METVFSKPILQKFKFKKDAYMRRRGTPVMLVMTCMHCDSYIIHYQKDGPGPLLRCYLDRIHHPEELQKRDINFSKENSLKLTCPSCSVVIGSPTIYEKENRPAYHLRPGFFKIKKIY